MSTQNGIINGSFDAKKMLAVEESHISRDARSCSFCWRPAQPAKQGILILTESVLICKSPLSMIPGVNFANATNKLMNVFKVKMWQQLL